MADVDRWIEQFRLPKPQPLSERDLWIVCEKVKELLIEENNVKAISTPVTICGDIHGQFYDLRELFAVGGELPEQHYVFLGDYVDRGYNSVETFQYLLLLKLRFPDKVTLLRGNHESRQITMTYGFYDECIRKYGNINAWKYCTDVFDYLTLGAVVDGTIFCVHGGLSPKMRCLDQLRGMYRFQEFPTSGAFLDVVWSDPELIEEWALNPRGAGWLFGERVVKRFNQVNGLKLISRAHQMVMEGYKYMFDSAPLVTVWSAPNYCYMCGNVASILQVSEDLQRKFIIFKETQESHDSVASRAVVPYFL